MGPKINKKTKKPKRPQKNWKKFWKLGNEEFNSQYFNMTKDGELVVQEGNYVYNISDIVKKYGTHDKRLVVTAVRVG